MIRQAGLYADSRLSSSYMAELREKMEKGETPVFDIRNYAGKSFSPSQIAVLYAGMETGGLSAEQAALYADPALNWAQMTEIRAGLEEGLDVEDVSLYADPALDPDSMNEMHMALKEGLTRDNLSVMLAAAEKGAGAEELAGLRRGYALMECQDIQKVIKGAQEVTDILRQYAGEPDRQKERGRGLPGGRDISGCAGTGSGIRAGKAHASFFVQAGGCLSHFSRQEIILSIEQRQQGLRFLPHHCGEKEEKWTN